MNSKAFRWEQRESKIPQLYLTLDSHNQSLRLPLSSVRSKSGRKY